jgi:hypothetical protein
MQRQHFGLAFGSTTCAMGLLFGLFAPAPLVEVSGGSSLGYDIIAFRL